MKKIYILSAALFATFAATAQISNAGMESWRNSTAGSAPTVAIHAPINWYGFDSLIIADGEAFSFFLHTGTNFHAQLYQESTHVNSGSYSAKVMTLKQDTLGIVPGLLSNATVGVNVFAVIAGTSLANATTFSGGTVVTGTRVDTVSAYVEYFAGIDSITHHTGIDTALLTVMAIGKKHGTDTTLGTGTFKISPTATFTQIKAGIVYNDTTDVVDTIRIIFSSSGGGTTKALDSSTLYVDDVSLNGLPHVNTVKNISRANDIVKVYPNPAISILNIDFLQASDVTFELYTINGQLSRSIKVVDKTAVDISYLPAGIYLYVVRDNNGFIVQKGEIAINH